MPVVQETATYLLVRQRADEQPISLELDDVAAASEDTSTTSGPARRRYTSGLRVRVGLVNYLAAQPVSVRGASLNGLSDCGWLESGS